jgi:hypothetical protein
MTRKLMTKLVYIGGYGHSGSTLLEYLMTASPQVIAFGEVVASRRGEASVRRCSCGKSAESCPAWGLLFQFSPTLDQWSHEDLDLELLNQVAQGHAIMVDSSKTAWHQVFAPFRLRRRLGQDFFLVQIVRDPTAVSWSLMTRSQRLGKRFYPIWLYTHTVAGWLCANVVCEVFRWLHPGQYHRVRYEELARLPHEVLTNLLTQLLPEEECRLEAIGNNDNRHQLYGNRMRLNQVSLADIQEDDAWRTSMPPTYQWLVACLSWILRRKYGYTAEDRQAPPPARDAGSGAP